MDARRVRDRIRARRAAAARAGSTSAPPTRSAFPRGRSGARSRRGESVTLADGRRVTPDGVLGPARPGPEGRDRRRHGLARSVVEAARGADLLVHEATFAEDERSARDETLHSTALEAAEVARDRRGRHARADAPVEPLLRAARSSERRGPSSRRRSCPATSISSSSRSRSGAHRELVKGGATHRIGSRLRRKSSRPSRRPRDDQDGAGRRRRRRHRGGGARGDAPLRRNRHAARARDRPSPARGRGRAAEGARPRELARGCACTRSSRSASPKTSSTSTPDFGEVAARYDELRPADEGWWELFDLLVAGGRSPREARARRRLRNRPLRRGPRGARVARLGRGRLGGDGRRSPANEA